MSNTAIEVSGVSKIYNIRERGYRSLRDSLTGSLNRLLQKMVRKNRNDVLSGTNSDLIYALKDVSFDVKRGETLGIIGVNGSGKSTILRLLANVTKPSSGEISVRGRVVPLIQVGAGFHPELTGEENIYLNATIMGLNKREIDEKYDSIVSFAELEGFMDTPLKRYSSGMYVRLGFAVAVHLNPDVLLIDEILAVGDTRFQSKCFRGMRQFRESNNAIVFVSHNMVVIESITDRVIVLNKGKISYEGKPGDAIAFYEHSLLGSEQTLSSDGRLWGTEEIRIKKVELLNSNNHQIEGIQINDPLRVKIDWECQKRIENPGVVVDIFKDDGTKVCCERSSYDGHIFNPFEGKGTLFINIKKIPLKRGNYIIEVYIMDLNKDIHWPITLQKKEFYVKDNTSAISEGIVSVVTEWSELG